MFVKRKIATILTVAVFCSGTFSTAVTAETESSATEAVTETIFTETEVSETDCVTTETPEIEDVEVEAATDGEDFSNISEEENRKEGFVYRDPNHKMDANEIQYALDLIGNQNSNKVRAGKSKREMISYLIYDSQYAVVGGQDWPVTNGGSGATSVTDSKLSKIDGTTTLKLDTKSYGCMAYAWFASGVVYTESVSLKSERVYINGSAGNYSKNEVKAFFKKELQAGEHIRIDESHSMVYISCDEDGFYYLEYPTSNDSDSHIRMSYAYFQYFTECVNLEKKAMWIYQIDANTNSSSSSSGGTQSSNIIDVGSSNTLYAWETEAAIEWALAHEGKSKIDDALNQNNELYGESATHQKTHT